MGSDIKRGGGEGRFISALCRPPDAFSICKYLQTAKSGIYVKVTTPGLAVQLFLRGNK